MEQLASRALTSGQRTVHIRRDEDGQIVGAGGDGEHQEEDDTAAESTLLHFSTPRDAATIAAFLRTRIYRPESLVWLEGYQALLRWRKKNEITGLHAVPYDVEVEVGATKAFPLGRWVHQQRKALRAGELEERRKTLLDLPEAGMVWEPGEEAWENKLAALRSYRRATGHLAPRQDALLARRCTGESRGTACQWPAAYCFAWCPQKVRRGRIVRAGLHVSMCATAWRGRRGPGSLLPNGFPWWLGTGTPQATAGSTLIRLPGAAVCWQRGAVIAVVTAERTQLPDGYRSV